MPYLRIVEQPAEKLVRFRYEKKGRHNISIAGAASTLAKRTYPAIEISNYTGFVHVIVSCVTETEPYRQHPHKVVCSSEPPTQKLLESGVHTAKAYVNGRQIIEFRDIGVLFVKAAGVVESLEGRKANNINPFKSDWDHILSPEQIDLHAVRLCFQVIGTVNNERKCLGMIASHGIFAAKCTADLVRLRIAEQPTDEIFRFQYMNEHRNATPIVGISSSSEHRTYPEIEISNYSGVVQIIVSLVSHIRPFRPHPHKVSASLHTPNGIASQSGVYVLAEVIDGRKNVSFEAIGIVFVDVADAVQSLQERRRKHLNPFKTDWDHIARPQEIDMDAARLCFQVIGTINGERKYLGALVSRTICFRTPIEYGIPALARAQSHSISELSFGSSNYDEASTAYPVTDVTSAYFANIVSARDSGDGHRKAADSSEHLIWLPKKRFFLPKVTFQRSRSRFTAWRPFLCYTNK